MVDVYKKVIVQKIEEPVQIQGSISGGNVNLNIPTTDQGNVKVSIEESRIQVPVDIQGSIAHKYSQAINVSATTAQSIILDTEGLKKLGIYASSTTATNFHLDVSNDNVVWINDYRVWNNVTLVDQVIDFTFRYARLRSDATTSGTVILILTAKI